MKVGLQNNFPSMGNERQENGKQQFVCMLPGTLEALCSMESAPHDDTILHHLHDIIKKLIVTEDDAKQSGVLDFVDTVKNKATELDSSVVVLALGVAAHLLSVVSLADDLWRRVTTLYDVIQSSVATGNSSVGAAYFKSLANVAAYPAGLQWLESTKIHFKMALSSLETAQSVFLLGAAETFVLTTLTNCLETHASELHSLPSSSLVVGAIHLLTKELSEMKKNRATLLDQMIVSSHVSTYHRSLTTIVSKLSDCKCFCEWKAGDGELISVLAHLSVQHSSDKIQSAALHSLVNLVGYMNKETREEVLTKEVVSPLLKLLSEGCIERALSIASAFTTDSQDTAASEALGTLQKLVQLPHDLLFGREIHCPQLNMFASSVTTALCDQQRFSRLLSCLLCSVKRTQNSAGLVRLVQTAGITRDEEDWFSVQSSWPQGVGAVIVNNHKLLNALLDLLQQPHCLDLDVQQCADVLTSFMRIMRRPLVGSRLYSQTCTAFLSVLGKHYQLLDLGQTQEIQSVLSKWVDLMEYRLVAVQWEIRDTTLELIRSVLAIVSDSWFHACVLEHHVLRHAWSCTKYGESYPRASAITLASSLISSSLWQPFLQDANITEKVLVEEMIEVLQKDPEAFPRRAAVMLLSALVSDSVPHTSVSPASDTAMHRHRICEAMVSAMNDFDWDVKLKVLDFWRTLAAPLCPDTDVNMDKESSSVCQRKRPASQQCCLKNKDYYDKLDCLLQDGFGKALFMGAEDYDTAVKQKALQMLAVYQHHTDDDDHLPAKTKKLTNTKSPERAHQEPSNGDASQTSVTQFLQSVSELNPLRQIEQQGGSAGEYDQKPASLLEDVISAVKQAAAVNEVTFMSEDEFEDADDMFVDCY